MYAIRSYYGPRFPACAAHIRPAAPAPMTITSNFSLMTHTNASNDINRILLELVSYSTAIKKDVQQRYALTHFKRHFNGKLLRLPTPTIM